MTRPRLAVALAVVAALGFATKIGQVPFLHNYVGGVLYVVFWFLFVRWLRPAWRPRRVALGVFLATCAVECLQLWHPQWLETVRASFLGRTLLGTTFAWGDFACYAVGAAAALLVFGRTDSA